MRGDSGWQVASSASAAGSSGMVGSEEDAGATCWRGTGWEAPAGQTVGGPGAGEGATAEAGHGGQAEAGAQGWAEGGKATASDGWGTAGAASKWPGAEETGWAK